ncbi:UNVERIFIED_CONTAM: hypothetical protein GTU68_010377 [Idotea baltica]
MSLRS